MASIKGNRTIQESSDFARGEQDYTNRGIGHLTILADPPATDAHFGGDGTSVVDLCPACGAPIGSPRTVTIPAEARSDFPLGPNGGVLIRRRVPGTDEWLEIEYFLPNDDHDDFRPVDPLLPITVAAIQLGLAVSTLYARAERMASSEKHGSRWFFKRDLLLTVDAASEHRVPTRREVVAEREVRRQRGEVLRSGSHAAHCGRRHQGHCPIPRRPRSEGERASVRRAILDDLGK